MSRLGARLGGDALRLLNRQNQTAAASVLNRLPPIVGEQSHIAADNPASRAWPVGEQDQHTLARRTMRNVSAATNLLRQSQLELTEIHARLVLISAKLAGQ